VDMKKMGLITVEKAAEIIGCTVGRVRQLLLYSKGELEGQKWGTAWMVQQKSVERYAKKPQKRGRPRKNMA
jgi:hypothetical protein